MASRTEQPRVLRPGFLGRTSRTGLSSLGVMPAMPAMPAMPFVVFVALLRLDGVLGSRDADTTYPLRFVADLLQGSTRGWVVPPTPYFFPEVLLLLPLQAFGGPVFAYGAYVVVMSVLLYLVICRISRQLEPGANRAMHRWGAAGAVALLAIPRTPTFERSVDVFRSVTSPAVHGGATIATLWMVSATHDALVGHRWSRRNILAFALVTYAAVSSDMLAVAHSAGPVAYLLFVAARRSSVTEDGADVIPARRLARPAIWAASYLAASAAGLVTTAALPLVGMRRFRGAGPQFDPGGAFKLLVSMGWWLVEHPGWSASVAICVAALLHRLGKRRALPLMGVALVVSAMSACVTTALLGFTQPADARRLLVVFVVPMIGAATIIASNVEHWLSNWRRTASIIMVRAGHVASVLAVVMSVLIAGRLSRNLPQPRLVGNVSHCVDALRSAGEIHAGLGSFWNTGELDLSSKTEAPSLSIGVDAKLWIALRNVTNLLQVDESGLLEGEPLDYVLVKHISQDAVLDSFGQPVTRKTCADGNEVWIYRTEQLRPMLYRSREEAQSFIRKGGDRVG